MKTTACEFFVLRHSNGTYLCPTTETVSDEEGLGTACIILKAQNLDSSAAWRAESARHAECVRVFPASKWRGTMATPGHRYAADELSIERVLVVANTERVSADIPDLDAFATLLKAARTTPSLQAGKDVRYDWEQLKAAEEEQAPKAGWAAPRMVA